MSRPDNTCVDWRVELLVGKAEIAALADDGVI
jgi:hypothetical protein